MSRRDRREAAYWGRDRHTHEEELDRFLRRYAAERARRDGRVEA